MQMRWYQQSSHGHVAGDLREEQASSGRDRRDDERAPELVAPERLAQPLERPADAEEREHADHEQDHGEHLADDAEHGEHDDERVRHRLEPRVP